MKIFGLFFITLLLLNVSCEKDNSSIVKDEDGVIISKPWLWRTELSPNELIGAYISGPAWYDNIILMGAMDENNIAYLAGVDIYTGQIKWKQDYIYQSDYFGFRDFYIVNNIVVHRDGTNVFCIDLKNGEYQWKHKMDGKAWHWPSGLDSLFFVYNVEPEPKFNYPVVAAYYGNVKDGNTKLFMIPDLGDFSVKPDLERINLFLGGFRYIKPFYDSKSHDIMLLCYYEKFYFLPDGIEQVSKSYVGLYNFSTQKWAYERVELGDYNFLEGFKPVIIEDRFYHILSSGVVECRKLYSGEKVWRLENTQRQFWIESPIIVGNKMIVMDERQRELIAYNIDTGIILWKETSAPTNSSLTELNGVIYYSSSADGRIHAVDVETGKHIWRLKSPDYEKDDMDFYMGQCNVIPGKNGQKGRVIVSSFSHGYCFEAVK